MLVRDVQVCNRGIHGTTSKPPRADGVKLAWEEVVDIINGSSPGVMTTAAHCIMTHVNCLTPIQ